MDVLLAVPDPALCNLLAFALRRTIINITAKGSIEAALAAWGEPPYDLVILAQPRSKDINPTIAKLRSISPVRLILLVEHPFEESILGFLRKGADLVLNLHVSPLILVEYAQGFVKRAQNMPTKEFTLDLGAITLDPGTRLAQLADRQPHRLTQLEFRLLHLLLTHRGQVIPSDKIIEHVWGYGEQGNKELVRGLVSRLRAKIEVQPAQQLFTHTIPGVGYLFDLES